MRSQPDFSDDLRNRLTSVQPAANLGNIETRRCASDDFEGREYSVYGSYVPVRVIIDFFAQKEEFAIEELSYVNESSDENDLEPHLNVFVADLRDVPQEHPAFVG